MHRSRLGVILFDHPAGTFDAATRFWSGVLGREVEPNRDSEFTELGRSAGFEVATQRLDEGSARTHVDIETDDLDAEVARLVALGATVVEVRDGWRIMADPGEVPFCLVGVQSPEEFEQFATTWP